jgi:hypothetical protein
LHEIKQIHKKGNNTIKQEQTKERKGIKGKIHNMKRMETKENRRKKRKQNKRKKGEETKRKREEKQEDKEYRGRIYLLADRFTIPTPTPTKLLKLM